MFTSMAFENLWKRGILFQERTCCLRSKFFLVRVNPYWEGRQNEAPEMCPFILICPSLEEVSFEVLPRKWNRSVTYSGAILLVTLYTTLAFCKNTLSLKDNIFRRSRASSKFVYSLLNTLLHARLCSVVILFIHVTTRWISPYYSTGSLNAV